MSPTMMLSELEYAYSVPGVKIGSGFSMYDRSWTGGGATRSDASSAFLNASSSVKSGIPLVWLSSWRSVMFAHSCGRSGRHFPTVSSRLSTRRATRESAVAPLNALATLANRMWAWTRRRAPVRRLATPARITRRSLPRWMTTMTPGGPSDFATSSAAASSTARSASDGSSGRPPVASAVIAGTTTIKRAQSAMPILNAKVDLRTHIGDPPAGLLDHNYLRPSYATPLTLSYPTRPGRSRLIFKPTESERSDLTHFLYLLRMRNF